MGLAHHMGNSGSDTLFHFAVISRNLIGPLQVHLRSDSFGGSKGHQGCAPLGSKFFHFHAVFGKNLQNNRAL